MALEEILKDVEQKGLEEREKVIRYYEDQFSVLKKKQDQQVADLTEEYEKRFADEKRVVERSILSSAEMDSFKIVRTKKSDLVDEAVGRAQMYFFDLIDRKKEYSEILNKMVGIAIGSLGQDCVITISKKDTSLVKNRTKLHFSYAKDDLHGGIIAYSKDGSMELDLSFPTVFANIADSIAAKISDHIGD
ncbi:MAG: hypothetical protein LVQ96_06305 [Thermoplasmatales archaeon]|nr:hypothetical protein [Thermoplasmatales archaeon]